MITPSYALARGGLRSVDGDLRSIDMTAAMIPHLPLAAVAPADRAYHVQRVVLPGAWSFHEHGHHGFCEVFAVESGTVRHRFAGTVHTLGPGSLAFVRERDVHALEGDGLSYSNVVIPVAEWWRFTTYVAEPDLVEAIEGGARPPVVQLDREVAARLTAALTQLSEVHHGPATRRHLAHFLCHWLPLLAAAARGEVRDRSQRPAWFTDLLTEVDRRLDGGLTAADLPRCAGLSAAHLSRTFRQHLGCTPTAWLMTRRLERAAVLLAHTDRQQTDIAVSLGFASLSYFHSAFRVAHGCNPGAYRKRHRGGYA